MLLLLIACREPGAGNKPADTGAATDTDTTATPGDSGTPGPVDTTDTAAPADAGEPDGPWEGDCPEADWSRVCWTLGQVGWEEMSVLAFDLDGGDMCEVAYLAGVDVSWTADLLRVGRSWVFPTEPGVVRLADDGAVEAVPREGDHQGAMVAWAGGIGEFADSGSSDFHWDPSRDALATRTDRVDYTAWHDTRLTASETDLYGTSHAASDFDVLLGGPSWAVEHRPLEQWDDWVWGMSWFDGALVLHDGRSVRVARFDAATGDKLGEIALTTSVSLHGLWCDER